MKPEDNIPKNLDKFDWVAHYPLAVDVCDKDGILIAMNRAAEENFQNRGGRKLLGTSLFDCRPPSANAIIRRLLAEHTENIYYVVKGGRRKLVHQVPWFDEGGEFGGLVETIIPLPEDVPVIDRG